MPASVSLLGLRLFSWPLGPNSVQQHSGTGLCEYLSSSPAFPLPSKHLEATPQPTWPLDPPWIDSLAFS